MDLSTTRLPIVMPHSELAIIAMPFPESAFKLLGSRVIGQVGCSTKLSENHISQDFSTCNLHILVSYFVRARIAPFF